MLQRLSSRAEFLLVTLICFGPFAARSIVDLAERKTLLRFDDNRALFILGVELAAAAIALLLLRARGWTLADVGLRPTMPQTVFGMFLVVGSILAISFVHETVQAVTGRDPGSATEVQVAVTWPVLIALTLINPLYDQVFGVAYVVRATESSGAAFAVTLTVVIRLFCHLDQGPIATVTILPLTLIFAMVYWRWRLVWPLVIAHAMMDFVGLMPRSM